MPRTIMSRLRLRAIKCPSCGAQLAFDSKATSVTCDYCQQVSQVVGGPEKKPVEPPPGQGPMHPSNPPLHPQVRPQVQMLPVIGLVVGIMVALGGSMAFFMSGRQGALAAQATAQTRAAQARAAQAATQARAAQAAAQARAAQAAAQARAAQASTSQHQAAESDPTNANQLRNPFGTDHAKARSGHTTSKARKTRKPDPYDVARSVKPAVVGCRTRDLQSSRFPIWYSSTISLTVQSGAFKRVRVTAKANESDPSKVHFKSDYDKEVTKSDLDQAKARFVACVKNGIANIKAPSASTLARSSGTVRFKMTHDGVPYGM